MPFQPCAASQEAYLHRQRPSFLVEEVVAYLNSLRTRLTKPGITAKVYLWMAAVIFGVLVITAITWVQASDEAQDRSQRAIDSALLVFDADLAQEDRAMNTLGHWLVGQESLISMVSSGDAAGITRSLSLLSRDNLVSSIMVTDREGAVLSRTRQGEQMTTGDNIRNLPGVSEALAGQDTTGVIQDSSGRLERFSALPVYQPNPKLPVGALVLGFSLDQVFATSLSKKLDKEIAVFYDDKLVLSTLTNQHGAPWLGEAVPAPISKAEKRGRASDFFILHTDEDDYLFKFNPLPSSDRAAVAMYGIGVQMETINATRLVLFRTYALGLVFIGLALALFSLLFARAIIAPAHKLLAATRKMSMGDLSSSISIERGDELGELAVNLDRARARLDKLLKEMAVENERLAAIVNSIGVAAVVTDHNYRILGVNRAAEMLLGKSQLSLLGQPLYSLFVLVPNSEAMPTLWNAQPAAPDGEHKLFVRARLPLRENPKLIVDIISTQVETVAAPGCSVHLLQDISAQEQSTRAKDDFIINLAHELRSPLASLRTSIELIIEDYGVMSKRDMGVMLRTLQKSSIKFQTLVENLIEVGNIQASHFRVKPVPTTIDDVIRDAVNHMNPLLQAKGQRLELKFEAEPKLIVMADRRRVLQVLINLITNASKYGPEDQPIILSSCRDSGFVFLGVTDRGPGIPPEEQKGLFQRFFRTKLAEEEGAGIGLGLALTKEIVEAHGGTVGLTSTPGQGTTFWFSLPESTTQDLALAPRGRNAIRSLYESSAGG
jgi:signal transduction histidine kinase/HAMP domain-containing protein